MDPTDKAVEGVEQQLDGGLDGELVRGHSQDGGMEGGGDEGQDGEGVKIQGRLFTS